jgi:hypothetical protein
MWRVNVERDEAKQITEHLKDLEEDLVESEMQVHGSSLRLLV